MVHLLHSGIFQVLRSERHPVNVDLAYSGGVGIGRILSSRHNQAGPQNRSHFINDCVDNPT